MSHTPLFVAALAIMAGLGISTASAQQPSPAEQKLRENLRALTLQLRTIQGERDALQAEKVQAELEKKALTQKHDALVKETIAEQEAAAKDLRELQTKVSRQEDEMAQLKQSLDKWKVAHGEVTEIARKKEGERQKLSGQVVHLQRRVDDQQRRNLEMYKIGTEILGRYERFGLGTALTAREPFIGTTRVKLQNLVQDYKDKLADERIKPQQ